MDNNQQQPQVQFDLDRATAKGSYSNFAIVSHGAAEFFLDFGLAMPNLPNKVPIIDRIILTPDCARRLVTALQENIGNFEKLFGPIKDPMAKGRTISPFGTPKGEA